MVSLPKITLSKNKGRNRAAADDPSIAGPAKPEDETISANTAKTAEPPKTPGEKFYDLLQFTVGKVTIMAFTAALAYTAKYGKDKYGPIPNALKQFQGW